MKAVIRLLNILITLFMIVSSIRIIPSVFNYKNIDKGIVSNKEYFTNGVEGGFYVIFIKKINKKYDYDVNEEQFLNYEINDSVTFRNLHNGGGVLVLSKNNIKMNSYYEVYDYIMLLLFVLLPFCYYFLNYKLKIK